MEILFSSAVLLSCLMSFVMVLAMLAKRSGWSVLARRYRANRIPEGKRWNHVTISVGRLFFRNRAVVCADDEAVYLALTPYMRPFHPPLLIPWAALTRHGGHTNQVVFTVGNPVIGEIRIPMAVVESVSSDAMNVSRSTTAGS